MITSPTGMIYSNKIRISYEFLYSGMMAVGLVTFSYVLAQLFFFIYKNRNYFSTEPDTSIKEALEYIIEDSNFGKSLQNNQHGRNDAVTAIKNLLLQSKIKLFGTSAKKPIIHKIGNHQFNNETLEIHYFSNENTSWELIDISFIYNAAKDNEEFKNLLVSKKQLKKWFPPKRGYFGT